MRQGGVIGQQIGVEDKLPQRALVRIVAINNAVDVKAEVDPGDITATGINGDDRLGELIRQGLQIGQGLGGIVGRRIAIDRLLTADLVRAGAHRLAVAINTIGLQRHLSARGTHPRGGHRRVHHAHGIVRRRQSGKAVSPASGGGGVTNVVTARIVEFDRDPVAFNREGWRIGIGSREIAAHAATVIHIFEDGPGDGGSAATHRRLDRNATDGPVIGNRSPTPRRHDRGRTCLGTTSAVGRVCMNIPALRRLTRPRDQVAVAGVVHGQHTEDQFVDSGADRRGSAHGIARIRREGSQGSRLIDLREGHHPGCRAVVGAGAEGHHHVVRARVRRDPRPDLDPGVVAGAISGALEVEEVAVVPDLADGLPATQAEGDADQHQALRARCRV